MNTAKQVVKQVGASGQISLGKEFAGRTVVVDSSEPHPEHDSAYR